MSESSCGVFTNPPFRVGRPADASPQPPLPNSNRVPDLLYAGEYPFASSTANGDAKLAAPLDADITSFIDLTMPADGLVPYAESLLRAAAIRGIAMRHIPPGIPDFDIPGSADQLRETLDIIDTDVREDCAVYVHCRGGVGRTGIVVGCHLVRYGMTGEQVLETVNRLFQTRSPGKVRSHRSTGSPQTTAQRDFVRTWSETS